MRVSGRCRRVRLRVRRGGSGRGREGRSADLSLKPGKANKHTNALQVYSSWAVFVDTFVRVGGVVEGAPDRISALTTASIFIDPASHAHVVATHDQVSSCRRLVRRVRGVRSAVRVRV